MSDTPKANYTGSQLEKFVENRIQERGYQLLPRDRFNLALYLEQPVYSRQFLIGNSIYDSPLYCDFVLYHPSKHPNCLIIECKWQQSVGTVDEKFPYFVLNIQSIHPFKTIIVLDGGGYKTKAEQWLRKQVGGNLLHVLSMAEFQKWANKGGI